MRLGDDELESRAVMDDLRKRAKHAASSNINVLILGETGVGKSVLARAIHEWSARKGELAVLNCAGLSTTLIEFELFGHERGLFVGPSAARIGLIEQAKGGTVFLEEIGEIRPPLQKKLLRTIESCEVFPVGAVTPRSIDVRFVASTNRDLEAQVLRGGFRQDLFFRLNGISLTIPPLRARVAEIPTLVDNFIEESCRGSGREPVPEVTSEAMDRLIGYGWPGNVRELKKVIEFALVLCDGPEIASRHLALDKMSSGPAGDDRLPLLEDPEEASERQRLLDALAACGWNKTRASQYLGMSRRSFVSKLDHYRIIT